MESHHSRRFNLRVPRTGLQVVTVVFLLLVSLTTRADLPVSFADEAICPVDVIWVPPAVLPYVGRDPTSLQVELESDQIDMPKPHVLVLTGGASVTQGAQSVYAENIVFDKNTFTLETGEAVVQSQDVLIMFSFRSPDAARSPKAKWLIPVVSAMTLLDLPTRLPVRSEA